MLSTEAVPRDDSSPAAAAPLALGWLQPLGLVGMAAFNYVARILTLGAYHFWGKTEVRKRIWSAVRVDGEPLVYTGTGRELLIGFLVVFGVVLLPVSLASFGAVVAFGPQSAAAVAFQLVVYVIFFLLYGLATFRAQRYRLSRTRWRGIAGSLEGSSWHYALTHFWTALLIPATLGWIIPWRSTRLQRHITSGMRFGNRPFTFTAGAAPLYLRFGLLWAGVVSLLVIASGAVSGIVVGDFTAEPGRPRVGGLSTSAIVAILGVIAGAYIVYAVISAWYRASQINHFAGHTHFEGATFRSSVTATGLIWLTVGNLALVILSLGLLAPLAQVRSARYFVEHLAIDGSVDLGTVGQGLHRDDSRGEGLAQALDFDAF
jgi:uncharacterized membrane protein YjgN (DUF898 family)